MMRPRPALALAWVIMLVAVASDLLTLLSGVSIIDRSVQQRASDLLSGELRLIRVALEARASEQSLIQGLASLAPGFNGTLAITSSEVAGSGWPVIRQELRGGKPWFVLTAPLRRGADDAHPAPGAVLELAMSAQGLEQEARTERDALLGTALLTLVLFGYALVGIGQWLGTQIEEREARLSIAKGELELALRHMSNGLCVFDADSKVTVFNQRFCEVLALPPGTLRRGASFVEAMKASLSVGNHPGRDPSEVISERLALIARRGPTKINHQTHDGRTIEAIYTPTADGSCVITCADITERLRTQQQITYMAAHDPITGLPNRFAFACHLERAVASASEGRPLALLCLDLDQFKQINDTWGHPAGDQLLRTVAERLRQSMRGQDSAPFRLGGDEFAITLSGIEPAQAEALARRIIRRLNRPCMIHGHRHHPRASIGIAIAPRDALEPDRLMSRADLALYAAKNRGRNAVHSFGRELEDELTHRAELESALQAALAQDQFELWYQPVFSVASGQLAGFEALLRWQHPQRGLVSPGDFVRLAEENELIDEIGAWTLRTACIEATNWPEPIGVAVNVSARQLRRKALLAQVEGALGAARLSPERLELEVTETAIIQNPEVAFEVLREIQARRVRIALDDFGTGYSSLSFLTRIKFDTIKIDRSFICDIATRADCATIVEAVSSLGAHMGLLTTAEGVETAEQLRRIAELGCSRAQGYLLGKPMTAQAARAAAWREGLAVLQPQPAMAAGAFSDPVEPDLGGGNASLSRPTMASVGRDKQSVPAPRA